MSSSLIGRKLGKYQVVEMLGKGGMATVYKGYQEDIDRYVAVKVLPPHPGLDEQFITRFKLEARTIARLQHPHILPLYDYGSEEGILYLVMAYMDGGTLSDLIDSGPMNLGLIEKILREIAPALDYAHRQGTIHRDIKPANILLDSEGHALLADFGIVKIAEGGGNLTGTGLVGTPAYMAPEQAGSSAVDSRADIYSLGVVVYEMLTGRQPYSADTPMQMLLQHMQEPIPDVINQRENLPPGISSVIRRVLAKNPNDRYQTAGEFAEDFAQAVRGYDDSVAGSMTFEQRPMGLPDPVAATQSPQPTSPFQANQTEPQQTIVIQGPAFNPLILLGGFAIIAVVIVVVVVVLVGNQGPTESTPATPQPSAIPTTQRDVAVVPTTVAVPTFGKLRFTTSTNPGDTVQLEAKQLSPLPSGSTYTAWLLNTANDETMKLGALTLDAFGTGSLTFVDPGGNVLPAWFNAVIVTAETAVSDTPAGEVRYSASVPWDLTAALREILVMASADNESTDTTVRLDSFTPTATSLLAGALTEARTAQQHASLAADSPNAGGLRTHAEHAINILLGTEDDYNGNGRGENPGKKIGVPFYLNKINALMDLAISGASVEIQNEGELIRVCTENARIWVDQVVALEKELVVADDINAVAQQRADTKALTSALVDGIDLNENGLVEPFEGECGLQQIETFGVLVASMDLVEGSLAEN